MKTTAYLFLFLALAALSVRQAQAAPIGTLTSQASTFSSSVNNNSYRVNSQVTYTRTSRGLSVSTGSANLFSVTQPAGPQNNDSFSEMFTIPESVIMSFY
jgi:hypothetical protein